MIQSIETVTFVRVEYIHPHNTWSDGSTWSDEYRIYPDGRVTELYDESEQDVFVCGDTITFIRELQAAAYPGVVFTE